MIWGIKKLTGMVMKQAVAPEPISLDHKVHFEDR